jgi:hypothetical protein
MRAAKVIGLGIFFSFVGFVMLLVISIMRGTVTRGPVSLETSHATGLSAVVGGIIEALFNPISLLVINGRVRCCDVVNAKDFQAHFHILNTHVLSSLPPGCARFFVRQVLRNSRYFFCASIQFHILQPHVRQLKLAPKQAELAVDDHLGLVYFVPFIPHHLYGSSA